MITDIERAHIEVSKALKSGKLKKKFKCEMCNKTITKPQAHHEDYSKPLEVIWLCPACHTNLHYGKDGNKSSRASITTIYLTQEQLMSLKELSKNNGWSMAYMIRAGIDSAITHFSEKAKQIVIFNEPIPKI